MPQEKKKFNPFYPLLVLVGIAFALTASGFGVMLYQESQNIQPVGYDQNEEGAASFSNLMNRYGTIILCVELVLLAIFTFGSIALDQYWISREKEK